MGGLEQHPSQGASPEYKDRAQLQKQLATEEFREVYEHQHVGEVVDDTDPEMRNRIMLFWKEARGTDVYDDLLKDPQFDIYERRDEFFTELKKRLSLTPEREVEILEKVEAIMQGMRKEPEGGVH